MSPDDIPPSAGVINMGQEASGENRRNFFQTTTKKVSYFIASLTKKTMKLKHFLPERTKVLDSCWYFFIIIIVGQLGPLIVYASTIWNGEPVADKIQESAGKAELLTCATAILAAGVFFLVKEYNSAENIINREIKSLALLWSAIIGLMCVLATVQLLAKNGLTTPLQSHIHWVLYSLAMVTAWVLWLLEESQEPAAAEIKAIAKEADKLTANAEQTTTSTGLRI